MISLSTSGSFNNIFRFLGKFKRKDAFQQTIEKYAQEGVAILSRDTPVRSGLTASSWDYEIEYNNGGAIIHWINSNMNKNVNIALILQYGHGTGTGGYVAGIDYINPATQKIFRAMVNDIWREVSTS